jgi:hypothetical protein
VIRVPSIDRNKSGKLEISVRAEYAGSVGTGQSAPPCSTGVPGEPPLPVLPPLPPPAPPLPPAAAPTPPVAPDPPVAVLLRVYGTGERDARSAGWLVGVLVADFTGLRLQDVASLKIDRFGLSFHIGLNPTGQSKKRVRQSLCHELTHRARLFAVNAGPGNLR